MLIFKDWLSLSHNWY